MTPIRTLIADVSLLSENIIEIRFVKDMLLDEQSSIEILSCPSKSRDWIFNYRTTGVYFNLFFLSSPGKKAGTNLNLITTFKPALKGRLPHGGKRD